MKPFAAVLAILALVFGSRIRLHVRRHAEADAGGARVGARLHDLPRAARRVELAARAADEEADPRADRGGVDEGADQGPTSSPSSARRCSRSRDERLRPARVAAAVRGDHPRRRRGGRRRAGVAEEPRRLRRGRARVLTGRSSPRASSSGSTRSSRPSTAEPMVEKLPVAFLAGLLSIVTPCVLPLVPGYLAAVSAVEVERLGERGTSRRIVIASIPFIIGFTIVFVILGAGAAAIASTVDKTTQTRSPGSSSS